MLLSWPNAPTERVIYSLEFLPVNCWNLTACTHRTPNVSFFVMKREFVNKAWIFCTPLPVVLRTDLRLKKTKTRTRNTKCGSTSPSCTDWRSRLQKCIVAKGSFSFKAWTTVALHGRRSNSFVAFRPDVFETLLSWAQKFSATFYSRFIWNTAKLKIHAFQQYIWVEACCYVTE